MFYTHEYNDGILDGKEGDSDEHCRFLMEFQDKSNNEFDGLEEKGTFIERFDRNISHSVVVIDVKKYSILGATRFLLIKNEEDEASSGTDFCSKCEPFSSLCNNDNDYDSETTKI